MDYLIKTLDSQKFAKYGVVMESGEEAGFEVFLNETEKVGWRLAISRLENKTIRKLTRHPNTVESFAPLQGVSLICVSDLADPTEIEVFLLDKPIYIHKNIWHGTLALSEKAMLSICENLYVDSEESELENPFEVVVKRGV